MKKILIVIFFINLCINSQGFAQEFKIEGSFVGTDKTPNLTLIRLSDDSIVWKGRTGNSEGKTSREFTIEAKSDDYVLCATCPNCRESVFDSIYYEVILPLKLTSDIDIGQVTVETQLIDSLTGLIFYLTGTTNTGTGISWEKQREFERAVLLPSISKYDLKQIFSIKDFWGKNYRIDEKANYVPKLMVDGELVDMNFLERMDMLKNMLAREVKYFEIQKPSELFPGGIIRIVTTAFAETEILPEGFYKIKGRLEAPSSLVLIEDNTVVWSSSTFLKERDSLQFSANIEKGNYVLVVHYSSVDGSRYIPINLVSDVNLGVIKRGVTPLEVIKSMSIEENWDKRDKLEGGERHIPGPVFKIYDMLRLLNSLGFWDLKLNGFRGVIKSDRIATIKIDGVAIEKDIVDLIAFLQSQPAKDVKYVDALLPSEGSPGGTINIVTTSGIQKEILKGSSNIDKWHPLTFYYVSPDFNLTFKLPYEPDQSGLYNLFFKWIFRNGCR